MHYESVIPKWENKYLNSLLGYFNLGDEMKIFPKTDYPRGSNMSFRTDVFQKAGMFNTELGRIGKGLGGGEEKDMFKRIYQLKDLKVIYIPNAVVYHCVPVERTTAAFIKNQAIGTGKSERIRVRHEGFKSTLSRFMVEFVKWGASFILFFVYLFKATPAKGIMIVRFRYWVTRGLLSA
ncbi:MAG: hypothetical protein IPM77_00155 [Crocinitomicaceae bacterium]|nr:hypothetical protein [Crocinitomicaceae bacterium]